MRKYLKIVSLFFLPILILFISAEILLRKTENIYSYKVKQIELQKKQIDILSLGSSNAFYGINPKYFKENKGFNLALISQSLNIDEFLLDKYIDELPSLKLVILAVGYVSLHYDIKNSSIEHWRLYDYFHYMNLNSKKLSINRWSLHTQSLILGKGFKNSIDKLAFIISGKYKVSVNEYGWGTDYANRPFSEKKFSKYVRITTIRHSNTISDVDEKKETIKRIVDKAKKRGITVFMITLPTSKLYRDNIKSGRMKKTISFFNSIANENDHVFYINYFKDSSFVNRYFFDAYHLNHRGSEKISKMIYKQIKNHSPHL